MNILRLYNFWRSSASWRVRIALNLKGLAYEYVAIPLAEGKQRAPEHHARNPMDQVPTLEVETGSGNKVFLSQSMAILEFLEEQFPQNPLLPSDPVLRARARELAEIVNSGIQPHQNLAPMGRIDALKEGAGKLNARHFNEVGLAALEAAARETAGQFLIGDRPTFADLCLIPQLYSARRFEVAELEQRFPTLLRVERSASENPHFRAAHAEQQPDAPKK